MRFTPNKKCEGFLAFIFVSLFTINISAHTLPISYLTLVPDGNYLHLELTLNPFELSFLSEFDANKNQALDTAELDIADKPLSQRILQHLSIKADGQRLTAEIAGLSGEAGGDHLTLRAHYRVANPQAVLSIESDLGGITSASHLTEVTFGREGQRQLARLDSQTTRADFRGKSNVPQKPDSKTGDQATTVFFVLILLAAIPAMGVFITLLLFAPKQLREEPAQH